MNCDSATGKHPHFIVHDEAPFNGGPPLELLAQAHVTPQELFFVRSHGTVPLVDPASYRCHIGGLVHQAGAFTLADLAALPQATVTATLQCAGNRRAELIALAPIPNETAWGPEAISTASWSGVRLCDLLTAAGIQPTARHVSFLGLDDVQKDGRAVGFGGSIPLEWALRADVLLATAMNGQPLPPNHGFPVRVIVPGYIGARSVKWLSEIRVQAEPSANYFQASAYRLATATPAAGNDHPGFPLGELSVHAVICVPEPGARLAPGLVRVAGYAMAGGTRHVARVELSTDEGWTWQTVELAASEDAGAWQLWQLEVYIKSTTSSLFVRAWDTAANSQPADLAQVWNAKGYMNNAWHRVPVVVE